MKKTFVPFTLSFLVLVPVLCPAQSDPTNAPIRLPEKVVTGEAAGGTATVPSAAQAREALQFVPGGVDVITAEEIRTGRAATWQDILKYSPGVFVQERFGAEEARVSIRGSGLQRTFHGRGLLIMQDGAPVNLADGGFDMQAIEPLSISYVEVLRGANALQFGATTLGGSINYISPTGYTADRFQVRGEYGSENYVRGQISSGMVLGAADYYASYSHYSWDGYRDHALQSAQRLFSNVGYRLSEAVETRFYLTHVLTDSELPGSLTKAQFEADPRQAAAASIGGSQQRDFDLIRVANKTTFTTDSGRFDVSTWWSHKDLFHPIPHFIDQNSHDVGVNAHYVREGELAGRANRFIVGLRPTYGQVEDERYANVGGNYGAKILSRTTEAMNLEGYFQNDWQATEKLALIVGLQYTLASRHSVRTEPVTARFTDTQVYHGISPKVGLRYDLTDTAQIYGNVSRSFEPPSFGEINRFLFFVPPGNQLDTFALNEQTATTIELGTRGEHRRFVWDVSVYHSWVDDELLSLNTAAGVPLGTVNADATRHVGIEAGLDTRLWQGLVSDDQSKLGADQLVLRQVYNWSHFVFDSDPVYGNNALAGIPEHFYRAELVYEHPCGFYLGPNVEWSVKKYAVDHARSWFADPYAILGAKIGYRSQKGFSVFLEAKNLADKTYAATTGVIADALGADNANFLPGVGRAIYGGIEWRW